MIRNDINRDNRQCNAPSADTLKNQIRYGRYIRPDGQHYLDD